MGTLTSNLNEIPSHTPSRSGWPPPFGLARPLTSLAVLLAGRLDRLDRLAEAEEGST